MSQISFPSSPVTMAEREAGRLMQKTRLLQGLGAAADAYVHLAPNQEKLEDYHRALDFLRRVAEDANGDPNNVQTVKPKKRVFLCLPHYGQVEPESRIGAYVAASDNPEVHIIASPICSSLLAYGLNRAWADCLNTPVPFDYFAVLHSDIAPEACWIDKLMIEMEAGDFDVMHAAMALKDSRGLTSTAYGSMVDEWKVVRRLTMTELHNLVPPTFSVEDLVRCLGADGFKPNEPLCMLNNTGVMLIRLKRKPVTGCGPFVQQDPSGQYSSQWPTCFPGFTIQDRIAVVNNQAVAQVVSEDWWFGRWCAKNGLKVGGTSKVFTTHFGRGSWTNGHAWGTQQRDESFFTYCK
jgi:hypothetical protein